jgi:hypothetical protein
MCQLDLLTLSGFWFATMVFAYSSWLNWCAYKRWERKYAELLREEYRRELDA